MSIYMSIMYIFHANMYLCVLLVAFYVYTYVYLHFYYIYVSMQICMYICYVWLYFAHPLLDSRALDHFKVRVSHIYIYIYVYLHVFFVYIFSCKYVCECGFIWRTIFSTAACSTASRCDTREMYRIYSACTHLCIHIFVYMYV